MLILLFQLGKDRYALEANRVVEVVPLLSLTKIPQAPKGVAGMFVYRGRAVPAVDLCELTIGSPARERLSTRIIVVDYSEASGRSQLLGLIVERATGMMRRDARDFMDAGLRAATAPFLGPVLTDDRGVIQLLHAQKLLPENVRDLVFAPSVLWPSPPSKPPPSPSEPMVRGVEGGEGETLPEASHAAD
jgi:chemotaxis-related protein WspB